MSGSGCCGAGDLLMTSQVYSHVVGEGVRTEVCDYCLARPGVYAEMESVSTLRRCSRCQVTYYCGRDCQKSSWREHREECLYLQKMKPRVPSDTVRLIIRILLKTGRDEPETLPNGSVRKFSDLMTHEADVLASPVRVDAFNYFLKIIQLCFGSDRFQPKLVFQVYCRILINSVEITDDFQESIGTGLFLALSSIDHSCRPNANVVFKGRSVEVRALESIPAQALENTRITYISSLYNTTERRKILKEQFYFTCNCRFCVDDCPSLAPTLSCSGCSALVVISDPTCQQCHVSLSESRLKDYFSWSDRTETLLSQENCPTSDILSAFKSGLSICSETDNLMIKIAEETQKRSLATGDMDQYVMATQTLLVAHRLFYPPNSIILWNSLALLSKALFSLEKIEEGRKVFGEALNILKFTYGEEHFLHKYMLSYVL